jgi:septum formation protein
MVKAPPMAPNAAADLVLASASPRRRELLERLGLVLQVIPADVDEAPQTGELAGAYVRRISIAKCDKVSDASPPDETDGPKLAVLGADTTVVVDATILGKPSDEREARAMLARLAGRRHEVITGTSVRFGGRRIERAVTTLVALRALQSAELDAYVASGEWRGKAGGYAVQGIAAAFVTDLRGSVTNVIGLPLAEVLADLLALGALPRYPPAGFGLPDGR